MSTTWYREETSQNIITWLTGLREIVPQWSNPKKPGLYPYSPNFFDVDSMVRRAFFVVPFHNFWAPSEDSALHVLRTRKCERLYATGFDANTESYLSSPMIGEALDDMQVHYLRYCLMSPIDESCFILNTYLDYWMVAAPFEVIREITGQSLDKSLDDFIISVREHELFEAGQEFAEAMTRTYRNHNKTLRKSG